MRSKIVARLRSGLALLRLREFALTPQRCPFCGPSAIVRLRAEDIGIRCLRCAASVVHMSIGRALRAQIPDIGASDVCEFSARGPLVEYLRRRARSVAVSEYFPAVAPGAQHAGVRCEDMQRLTYADASFDVVTCTEVLEHVPDDARAFAELLRVLRPGGSMLFTVPLNGGTRTLERACMRAGAIEHLQPPVYHTDPLRGTGILAFRDYGTDIVERLRAAGFAQAWIEPPPARLWWGYARSVIIARCRVASG